MNKSHNTLRPLNATLQARINDSVLRRLANKLESEGTDVAEWLRETAEFHLKGMLRRGEEVEPPSGPNDEQFEKILSELSELRSELALWKTIAAQFHQRIRSDLAQFFIALLCNPNLLPDGMVLNENDLGHLISCMFPDLKDGGEHA